MRSTNRNFYALLALAGLLGAAAFFLGPKLQRQAQFKRECRAVLAAAEAGNTAPLLAACQPAQQAELAALLTGHVPANYQEYVQSIELSSHEFKGDGEAWALVTAHFAGSDFGNLGMALGRLHWVWDPAAQRWEWDPAGSFGAEYPTSGEAQWVSLEDFISREARP
jgi:hypothetical protein